MAAIKWFGIAFTAIIGLVVLFQGALIFGAPWGDLALRGSWKGVLPLKVRWLPALSIVLLIAIARVVLGQSNITQRWGPRWLIWLAIGYMAVGIVMHIFTPSQAERALWMPVLSVLFALALYIGILGRTHTDS
jgi:hypothetical protein